ncbi:MAG: hypothetical protein ACYTDU_21260 [Planctomycetota bacterium]
MLLRIGGVWRNLEHFEVIENDQESRFQSIFLGLAALLRMRRHLEYTAPEIALKETRNEITNVMRRGECDPEIAFHAEMVLVRFCAVEELGLDEYDASSRHELIQQAVDAAVNVFWNILYRDEDSDEELSLLLSADGTRLTDLVTAIEARLDPDEESVQRRVAKAKGVDDGQAIFLNEIVAKDARRAAVAAVEAASRPPRILRLVTEPGIHEVPPKRVTCARPRSPRRPATGAVSSRLGSGADPPGPDAGPSGPAAGDCEEDEEDDPVAAAQPRGGGA